MSNSGSPLKISSFFAKRQKPKSEVSDPSVIDLSLVEDDDTAPSDSQTASGDHKRRRLNDGARQTVSSSRAQNGSGAPSRSQTSSRELIRSGVARKRWRYADNQADDRERRSPSPEIDDAERARRQALRTRFASQLLTRNEMEQQRADRLREPGVSPMYSPSGLLDGDELEAEEDIAPVADSDVEESTLSKFSHKGVKKPKGKAKQDVGPSGQTCTPLEKQVLKLKEKHPGVLLLVEVGYKYRFFGDDAQTASKALGIACFPNRNFLSASIPVHRGIIHAKKLVHLGHKVGIVGQAETAALKKVSENRNAPFERKLSQLFTPSTFMDPLDSADDLYPRSTASQSLCCIVEQPAGGMGRDERVTIGLVCLDPSTGDLVYDEFEDGHMRIELETRLVHLKPCELIVPAKSLSTLTSRMTRYFSESASSGEGVRVEEVPILQYPNSLDLVLNHKDLSLDEGSKRIVTDLPRLVVVACALCVDYLDMFGMARAFAHPSHFKKFTDKAHMLLNANTIANLEIFENQTDFQERGSLLWVMDNTRTRFGSRLFRQWISKPMLNQSLLQERLDAVDELSKNEADCLQRLKSALRKLPDLAKGLSKILYKKAKPSELAKVLEALSSVSTIGLDVGLGKVKSPLLRRCLQTLPELVEPLESLLRSIHIGRASLNDLENLWRDEEKYPNIEEAKLGIAVVEADLETELKNIRKLIKRPTMRYVTVLQDENLVEIPKGATKEVPASWIRVSSTRAVTRWHTPEIKRLVDERQRFREMLASESAAAFQLFMEEVSQYFVVFRNVISHLAIFDCLNSLSVLALKSNYSKPTFVGGEVIDITQGRHPIAETLMTQPFIANSITLGGVRVQSSPLTCNNAELERSVTPDTESSLVNQIMTIAQGFTLTYTLGPNMGGKSSFVRMIALIVVMAQIGSYAPASEVRLSLHDAVFTRMGASDEIAKGRSTFMVEMTETSDILASATERSLVILDELGRGTSTYDGVSSAWLLLRTALTRDTKMAIAQAVLDHIVSNIKCRSLFITHYPTVASEMGKLKEVANSHMSFTEVAANDGSQQIQFLYKIAQGISRGSFGVECARLAGIPAAVLDVARQKATSLEDAMRERRARNTSTILLKSISAAANHSADLSFAVQQKLTLQQYIEQRSI